MIQYYEKFVAILTTIFFSMKKYCVSQYFFLIDRGRSCEKIGRLSPCTLEYYAFEYRSESIVLRAMQRTLIKPSALQHTFFILALLLRLRLSARASVSFVDRLQRERRINKDGSRPASDNNNEIKSRPPERKLKVGEGRRGRKKSALSLSSRFLRVSQYSRCRVRRLPRHSWTFSLRLLAIHQFLLPLFSTYPRTSYAVVSCSFTYLALPPSRPMSISRTWFITVIILLRNHRLLLENWPSSTCYESFPESRYSSRLPAGYFLQVQLLARLFRVTRKWGRVCARKARRAISPN